MRLILLLSIFICTSVSAKVWTGQGKLLSDYHNIPCEKYILDIDLTNHIFSLNNGHYICNGNRTDLIPRDYTIHNNLIYNSNDEIVGEVKNDAYILRDKNPEYELFVKINQDELYIVESYINESSQKFFIGILK